MAKEYNPSDWFVQIAPNTASVPVDSLTREQLMQLVCHSVDAMTLIERHHITFATSVDELINRWHQGRPFPKVVDDE